MIELQTFPSVTWVCHSRRRSSKNIRQLPGFPFLQKHFVSVWVPVRNTTNIAVELTCYFYGFTVLLKYSKQVAAAWTLEPQWTQDTNMSIPVALRSNPGRSCPTFTTVDHIWSRCKNRWLTAQEKLCALGFPAEEGIANAYGVDPCAQNCLCFGRPKRNFQGWLVDFLHKIRKPVRNPMFTKVLKQ